MLLDYVVIKNPPQAGIVNFEDFGYGKDRVLRDEHHGEVLHRESEPTSR